MTAYWLWQPLGLWINSNEFPRLRTAFKRSSLSRMRLAYLLAGVSPQISRTQAKSMPSKGLKGHLRKLMLHPTTDPVPTSIISMAAQ